jgi:glycosyltransferase involved in cell wall biosynthesis
MIKTDFPFFSVIIATFNRAGLIKNALNSVIAQTETNWEVLIIDDGSTDNTYDVVGDYLKSYRNIRYYSFDHRGMVLAKNAGINAAKGKYITFLDSDDEYHPLHLSIKKSALIKDPALQFLYGKVKIIGNQYVPDRFDQSKLIHLDKCVAGGNFVFESGTLRKLKGYRNLKFGVDADLFDRAVLARLKMSEISIPTYIYHHDTLDSNTNRMMMMQII